MYIETEGIVIRVTKYSEADLILHVFTRKMGRITVFSKASKRIKSPFMSSSQPFAYSSFYLAAASGSYRLQRAELIKSYYKLTTDLNKYYHACYILEFTEKVLFENQTNIRLFSLVQETLEELEKNDNVELIRIVFEILALDYIGSKPEVLKCANCGINNLDRANCFSIVEGGVICKNCCNKINPVINIDTTTIRLMEYIYSQDFKTSANAKVSPIIIKEMRKILDYYILEHLGDLKLKSTEFINNYY